MCVAAGPSAVYNENNTLHSSTVDASTLRLLQILLLGSYFLSYTHVQIPIGSTP
jgi:hypothetical protein